MGIISTQSQIPPLEPQSSRRNESARVMQALDDLCVSLAPGDRVPTHVELMRRFKASERMVLRGLDEMRRQGRIVRRHGAGTFIADQPSVVASDEKAARTIVAIAQPDRAFFDQCMNQLYEYANAAGLSLLCQPLDLARDSSPLSLTSFGNPLGFIFFGNQMIPLARNIQKQNARVVLLGTPPAGEILDIPCVHGAQEHGGYLCAKYLLDLGHRRLAFVPSTMDITRSHRWQGMQRALREARRGGAIADITIVDIQERDSWRDSPERAAAYIRRADGPTGILSWNDHECARLLSILLRADVQIPGEVSLVGYDALPEGELVSPALTTINPFLGQLLQIAISILLQPDIPASHTSVVMPTLVIRDSTAPPRND
jgi:DNA-binding LacI/PurR family transcriptional regulator